MRGSFLGSERLVDLLPPGCPALTAGGGHRGDARPLLDEERRLFYVAVTRARRALLVTAVTSEREGAAARPGSSTSSTRCPASDPRPLTPVHRPLS